MQIHTKYIIDAMVSLELCELVDALDAKVVS